MAGSHTIAVRSTEPDSSASMLLFHLSEKMGPRCRANVRSSSPVSHGRHTRGQRRTPRLHGHENVQGGARGAVPLLDQMRAAPS